MILVYFVLVILNLFFAGWDFADWRRTGSTRNLVFALISLGLGILVLLALIGRVAGGEA